LKKSSINIITGALFGTRLEEGSTVTNIYLLQLSTVKFKRCALSLII